MKQISTLFPSLKQKILVSEHNELAGLLPLTGGCSQCMNNELAVVPFAQLVIWRLAA